MDIFGISSLMLINLGFSPKNKNRFEVFLKKNCCIINIFGISNIILVNLGFLQRIDTDLIDYIYNKQIF